MSSLGNKEVFAKNLRYYMTLNAETRVDICDKLGFPYTTFVGWETAQTYPRIDKIEKLARHFGINKSDLIECKDAEQKTNEPAANGGLQEGIELFSSLSPEARKEALEYMRYLRDRREPQK